MPQHVGLPVPGPSLRDTSACALVVAPFPIFALIGTASSNTFVGRAQVRRCVYLETQAQPGDRISVLPGGVFFEPRGLDILLDARPSIAGRPHALLKGQDRVVWPETSLRAVPYVDNPRALTIAAMGGYLNLANEGDLARIGTYRLDGGMEDIVLTSLVPGAADRIDSSIIDLSRRPPRALRIAVSPARSGIGL